MDQQVNILCEQKSEDKSKKIRLKYKILDPKPSDLTLIRSKSSNRLLLQKYLIN
jgi:hypothetical protein